MTTAAQQQRRNGLGIFTGLFLLLLAMIAGVSNFADTTINMWDRVSSEVSGA